MEASSPSPPPSPAQPPASPCPEQGKLFVGGIPSNTTESDLRAYFQRYGKVAEVVVPRDRFTGRGRGFGFVQFAAPEAAARALVEKQIINGRVVEMKRAEPKGVEDHSSSSQLSQHQRHNQSSYENRELDVKKIFIGGLPLDFEEYKLTNYFQNFGDITDAVVITDPSTKRSRGFGFVTFKSEESVNQVIRNKHHYLSGATVEVKRAMPRDGMSDQRRPAFSNLSESAPPFYPRGYGLPNAYVLPTSTYYYNNSGVAGYSTGVCGGMEYCNPHAATATWMGQRVFLRQTRFPYGAAIIYHGDASAGFTGYMGCAAVSCQQVAAVNHGGGIQTQLPAHPEAVNDEIAKQLRSVNLDA